MNSGIYKIHFGLNKCYIGSAVNLTRRMYDHKSRLKHNKSNCIKLQRAFNKYGMGAFSFEIIEHCKVAELRTREAYWIAQYDAVDSGYNIAIDTTAPMLGRKHSDNTKKLMSAKAKGNKGRTGQKSSEEHLRKLRISLKGINKGNSNTVGEKNGQAKITALEAQQIKELKGFMFQRDIAEMFGISQTQVCRIHNGIKWKFI